MSSEVDTVQTTQQATPFLPQQGHLMAGFDAASRLYNRPDQTAPALRNLDAFYNGDPRLTNIWNQERGAADQLSGIASGNIGYRASPLMQDFMGGKFLDPETNPWLKGAYEDAAGQVRGQVNSQFSGAGRYGSGANQEILGRNLGQLANTMYGGAYQQGMNQMLSAGLLDSQLGAQNIKNQMTAASLYPSVARSFLQDPLMQAQVQERISNQPWADLDRYMGTLRGAPSFGSTTTGSQPFYSSPVGEGIGAAGGLLLAGNLAFGANGLFPGAFSGGVNPFDSGGFDASGLNLGDFGSSWGY